MIKKWWLLREKHNYWILLILISMKKKILNYKYLHVHLLVFLLFLNNLLWSKHLNNKRKNKVENRNKINFQINKHKNLIIIKEWILIHHLIHLYLPIQDNQLAQNILFCPFHNLILHPKILHHHLLSLHLFHNRSILFHILLFHILILHHQLNIKRKNWK